MTKADLVERVADTVRPRVTKKDCGLVVEAFLASVQDALVGGDGIEIRGFGTFKVRRRTARTARNPRTGELVEVPPRIAPVFQPSRLFLDRMNRPTVSAEEAERGVSDFLCKWPSHSYGHSALEHDRQVVQGGGPVLNGPGPAL